MYEMVNQVITKHDQRPADKQSDEELNGEVELMGAEIGKKVTDRIALNYAKKGAY